MIGRLVQSYRIIRQLGAGGMGVVYEAEDSRLGRHVAMKFLPQSLDLSPETAARFEREARIASSINHPNICTIFDVGVFDDEGRPRHFIVMELLEGDSLKSRIHGQPLPIDQTIDVGVQIADALDAAHAQGVVHRDIKPANIFITKRGQAKLLDFGVAKPGGGQGVDDEETRAHAEALTTAGTTVGSIHYMSPEQARGEALDPRTDLFSLGLVLYEMATGRQAFAGATTALVFDAILNRSPAPVGQLNADVPEELERVIMRALEKDKQLRYQTAGDLVADLKRLRRDTDVRRLAGSGSLPVATAAHTAVPQSATRGTQTVAASTAADTTASGTVVTSAAPRGRMLWLGLAAALGVAVIAGGGLWWSQRTSAPNAPALTSRDAILIADFVNTTGDAVFDDALKQAVAVQLQQTPFVTLLPDPQIQRTLQLMQRPADERVIGAVAREVCQRAGARATVEGSIAPLGSSYVIALGVHDCQTGASIARQQTQADAKEGVLKAVGGAVTALRETLGESLASIQKNDVPAEATTRSLEALRAYGLAIKTRMTRGDAESLPFFKQAIERDPNFALAYAKAGVVHQNLGFAEDAKAAITKAYELRDRVSEYERLYIEWSYARMQGDDAKQKETLELLTTTYPRDFAARNNFGTYYMGKGKFEEALEQFRAAHDLGPGEPLPSSNAAYALLYLGRYPEALPMIEHSLGVRPNPGLAVTRWVYAHVNGDPQEAAWRDAAVKISTPDNVQSVESGIAAWDGRVAEYVRIEADRLQKAAAAKAPNLSSLEWNGRITRALMLGGAHADELRRAMASPTAPPQLVAQSAVVLAILGDLSAAKRELPKLERAAAAGQVQPVTLNAVRAYAASADGKHDQALALAAQLPGEDRRQASGYVSLAQLQLRAGHTDEAIAADRKMIDAAPAQGLSPLIGTTRLELAKLLADRGDTVGARAQLDVLARQWVHADADFKPAIEAKALLQKIGAPGGR
jgi:tetratricopeptide (TPR) repeat protein/tRNA A-37 threonylcarbamoyl transferase component Bud32